MYHVNPVGVIEANPDLAGKVKQAYIFCKACNKWQNLTTENSIQLPFGEFSFQKECYVGGFCWTSECNQVQYEKEEKQKAKEEKEAAKKNIMFWSLPTILVIDIKRFNASNQKNQVL